MRTDLAVECSSLKKDGTWHGEVREFQERQAERAVQGWMTATLDLGTGTSDAGRKREWMKLAKLYFILNFASTQLCVLSYFRKYVFLFLFHFPIFERDMGTDKCVFTVRKTSEQVW